MKKTEQGAGAQPDAVASSGGKPETTAADVLANDEHAGKGGSYVFDPAAGKRTPTAETAEQHQAADQAVQAEKGDA